MRQPLRTAAPEDSIWKNVTEETFHKHVAALMKKTLQPVEPRLTFDAFRRDETVLRSQAKAQESRALTIEVEERLANDFAFLAATEEGARHVAACCIEERTGEKQKCLILRLAGNSGIPQGVEDQIRGIVELLRRQSLEAPAAKSTREQALNAIIDLDKDRIQARVDSVLGHLPKFRHGGKDPKAVSLQTLGISMRKKAANPAMDAFLLQLKDLAVQLRHARQTRLTSVTPSERASECRLLVNLVKACYDFSTNKGLMVLVDRLAALGLDGGEWSADKRISQIDKLGAYWRIARTLTEQFGPTGVIASYWKVNIECLEACKVNSDDKAGKLPSYHVHAEIQVVMHYLAEHPPNVPVPRVIGVSKDACFLCFLFVGYYNSFVVPQTHGKLHDQWTVPDLQILTRRQRATLRKVVEQMDHAVTKLAGQSHPRRKWAIQSRHNVIVLPLPSATVSAITVSALPSIVEVLHNNPGPVQRLPQSLSESGEASNVHVEHDWAKGLEQGPHQQASIDTVSVHELDPDSPLPKQESLFWTTLSTSPTRLHVDDRRLEMYVEVESPMRGRARVWKETAVTPTVNTSVVDISRLAPGEEVCLAKAESNRSLVIVMQDSNDLVCRLELGWIGTI